MAVRALRCVTAPLLAVGLVAGGLALLAGCGGGTRLAGSSLPGDGNPSATGRPPSPGPSGTGAGHNPGQISGQQWLQAAHDAFAAAPSVHVTGTAVRGADAYVLDVRLAGAAGGTATITTSGMKVQVVRIGADAYVGGDRAFWQSVTGDAAKAGSMVGSYVKTPVDGGNFGSYVAFTLPATFLAVLPSPSRPATVGPETTIAGRPAVPVRDGAGSTLSAATTGPAYPLRLDGLASGQVVFLDFADYGEPVPLRAPPTGRLVGGLGS